MEAQMLQSQDEINTAYSVLAAKESLLPIKVSTFYAQKVEDEVLSLGHRNGPLHRIVYPSSERLDAGDLNEVADFVDDRSNMPQGLQDIAVRKYKNRLLVFLTTKCFAHCQYCFRQDVLSELHASPRSTYVSEQQLAGISDYLRQHPEIDEVILSGGDPMIVPASFLGVALDALTGTGTIRNIRIHTRAAAYLPHVFDDDKIKLLATHNVRLVSHICHPYEICETVAETFHRLRRANVRLYNQFPLIRGVNDHVDVLKRLLNDLDNLGIRNLSMFVPDPIKYSASFRIRYERICAIVDALNHSTSSWINSTRVVLDTSCGKVRREDIVAWDKDKDIIHFQRDGKMIVYHDFPAVLDRPSDIDILLWRTAKEHAIERIGGAYAGS